MFSTSSIMVLLNNGNRNLVQLLEMDKPTQTAICNSFADACVSLLSERQMVSFDGSYKPNTDEGLSITDFRLPEIIADAVKNPLGLQTFSYSEETEPGIKAVFVGERTMTKNTTDNTEAFTIAFQLFRNEQYLSTKKFRLYFEENVFKHEKRWGIGITDTVDCIFTQTELRFSSYFYARQIFDLSDYYRFATDAEVQSFCGLDLLSIADKSSFQSMADNWVRRKIAAINDTGVLENNTAAQIKKLAKSCGLEVVVENKKLVIPSEKKKLKELLGFLDEEVYKGAFTKETYITNSKRKVR